MSDNNVISIEESIKTKDDALRMIRAIGMDYDGLRKPDSLMELIDELCEIAGVGLDLNNNNEKRTLEEWQRIKDIKIVDPDGFRVEKYKDREKYTEEEFDEALMFCTLEIDLDYLYHKKYRKKPVEIRAIKWVGLNYEEVDNFIGEEDVSFGDGVVIIHTLEGDMRANIGDYIIEGVEGEYYPCKPGIFGSTYERVE